MPLTEALSRRLRLADALYRGECEGTYADACLILSAAVASMSAQLWPGSKMPDKKRFVELWARHAPGDASRISVPRLIRRLHHGHNSQNAQALLDANPDAFGPGSMTYVLNQSDCDMADTAVAAVCPTLPLAKIREASYPAIFYTHVRSGIVHEYELGDEASKRPMRDDAQVSYVNRGSPTGNLWLIHFHFPWLLGVARSLIPAVLAGQAPPPSRWWLEG